MFAVLGCAPLCSVVMGGRFSADIPRRRGLTYSCCDALATELSQLRLSLRQDANEIEHDVAIASVASAEAAAKGSNAPAALQHLKAAGKWALCIECLLRRRLFLVLLSETLLH
jgi:hypothetical protein